MLHIDFLSVAIATIVFFVTGAIGMHLSFWKPIDVKNFKRKAFWIRYGAVLAIGFIFSYYLAFFEQYVGVTSFWDGVFLGFLVWLGFIFSSKLLFYVQSTLPGKKFLVDMIYWLVLSMLIGGILAG